MPVAEEAVAPPLLGGKLGEENCVARIQDLLVLKIGKSSPAQDSKRQEREGRLRDAPSNISECNHPGGPQENPENMPQSIQDVQTMPGRWPPATDRPAGRPGAPGSSRSRILQRQTGWFPGEANPGPPRGGDMGLQAHRRMGTSTSHASAGN
eukprot:2039201-Pyramimonas_sp.AAC.1